MRKLVLLTIAACFLFVSLSAQKAPKWMNKSKNAVVTITTYDKDNRKIASTNGFFISETGEALSAYTPFNGADRATVTDADGNTYNVTSVVGADDLYDVIKLKVAVPKKVPFLPLASDPVPNETSVFLLLFSTGKEASYKQAKISEVTKLKDPYSYYKITLPIESGQVNAPLLLPDGRVFALSQEDASGKKEHSYGVSASYVNSLQVTSTDAFNRIYTSIGIRKAWPSDPEQASISLFLLAGSQDAKTYLETLNDFIATFPSVSDGYVSRASLYAGRRAELSPDKDGQARYLELALADLNTAAKYTPKKADAYYNQAKLIFEVAVSDTTITDNNWSLATALATVMQAINEEDSPIYRQLEGEIYLYMGEYPSAYASYMKVNSSDMASSSSFYLAAKSLENIPGAQISDIITLLDSAIVRLGTPTSLEAAPYILERIDHKIQLSLFKEAVEDYNLYYMLVDGNVNDQFFYYRQQAKFRADDNEGALRDIQEAIRQNAGSPDYYAEEAAIYVRLQKYNEALASVEKALELAPDFGACYRIRGVCYVRLEKKTEACAAFEKAKEYGDPLVDRLMREHCK